MVVKDVRPRTSYFFLLALVFLMSIWDFWDSLTVVQNAGWAAAGTIFFSWSFVMPTRAFGFAKFAATEQSAK